uniref:F-box domain-containing protein n=1 Tax=Mycena chlorophos TaxID=658473 RepID=A0ABQ0L1N0_MYCCL|nr:predicted protein [Mycena chlorophos]
MSVSASTSAADSRRRIIDSDCHGSADPRRDAALLKAERNELSSIHVLPPEVLAEIFHCLHEVRFAEARIYGRQCIETLRLVCRRWNGVVLSTPKLWAGLDSHWALTEHLERSGSLPLDVKIHCGVSSVHRLDLLLQNAARIQSLTIVGARQDFPPVLNLLENRVFLILRCLSVTCDEADEDEDSMHSGGSAPLHVQLPLPFLGLSTLRRLELDGVRANIGLVSGLTSLDLSGEANGGNPFVPASDLLRALQACPLLKRLAISLAVVDDFDEDTVPATRIVPLLSLEHLSWEDIADSFAYIMSRVRFARTATIDLRLHDCYTAAEFEAALAPLRDHLRNVPFAHALRPRTLVININAHSFLSLRSSHATVLPPLCRNDPQSVVHIGGYPEHGAVADPILDVMLASGGSLFTHLASITHLDLRRTQAPQNTFSSILRMLRDGGSPIELVALNIETNGVQFCDALRLFCDCGGSLPFLDVFVLQVHLSTRALQADLADPDHPHYEFIVVLEMLLRTLRVGGDGTTKTRLVRIEQQDVHGRVFEEWEDLGALEAYQAKWDGVQSLGVELSWDLSNPRKRG